MIKEAKKAKNNIKITINTSLNIADLEAIIEKGLKDVYNETNKFDEIYDNKQISFFIMGVIFLIFATLIKYDVIKEIIIGCFVIWEGVDIALNLDTKFRINKKILKKLINSEIEINKK